MGKAHDRARQAEEYHASLVAFQREMGFDYRLEGPHRWDDDEDNVPGEDDVSRGLSAVAGHRIQFQQTKRLFFHGAYRRLWMDTFELVFAGRRGGPLTLMHVSRVYLPRRVPELSITPKQHAGLLRRLGRVDHRIAPRLHRLFTFDTTDRDFAARVLNGGFGEWLLTEPRVRQAKFNLQYRWLNCSQPGRFHPDRARAHLELLHDMFHALPENLRELSVPRDD